MDQWYGSKMQCTNSISSTMCTVILSNLVTCPLRGHATISKDGTKIVDKKQRMPSEGLECWDQVAEAWEVDPLSINGLFMAGTFSNVSYSSRDKIDFINYFNYSPSPVSTSLPCDFAISSTIDDSGVSNLTCSSH